MEGAALLHEVLVNGSDLTAQHVNELETVFETTLREATAKSDSSIMEVGASFFTDMILAFNPLLAGVLDHEEYLTFSCNPPDYIDKHLLDIPDIVESRLQELVQGSRSTKRIAKAYTKLIEIAIAADSINKIF
jgi:hypothetical protein